MSTKRRATYPAARRIARLMYELPSHPNGWSFDEIQTELSIGERTLLRYVDACRTELVDPDGQPLIQVVQRGTRRLLRLRDTASYPDAAALTAVSMFFTLAMVRALEGTSLQQSADAVWSRMLDGLPAATRSQLANLDRKFYALSFVPKDYAQHAPTIDEIVKALVREYRIAVTYDEAGGETVQHDLEPYTLLSQNGGLYLIGRSHQRDRTIRLAVERIRHAEPVVEGAHGRARFTYPDAQTFHPARSLDGQLGGGAGEAIEIDIALLDEQLARDLQERPIHPSQRLEQDASGCRRLLLTAHGTDEVASWVMSVAPSVEVVRPGELREEIGRRLAAASARYAT